MRKDLKGKPEEAEFVSSKKICSYHGCNAMRHEESIYCLRHKPSKESKEETQKGRKLVGRRELVAPRPGFEPGSKPRQGFMIGHYTIGAGLGTTTVLYFNRSRDVDVVIYLNRNEN